MSKNTLNILNISLPKKAFSLLQTNSLTATNHLQNLYANSDNQGNTHVPKHLGRVWEFGSIELDSGAFQLEALQDVAMLVANNIFFDGVF